MPGREDEVYQSSFITQERVYRRAIAQADTDPAAVGIPIVHLDLNPGHTIRNPALSAPVKYDPAYHGYDAVIGIHVVASAANVGTTLQLWRRLDDATGTLPVAWCLAYQGNATGSVLVRVGDLIAGKYKVLVSALANGTVDLAISQTV